MIIPWQVDVPQDRWPVTNWLIVASNIILFILIMTLLILGYLHETGQQSAASIMQIIEPYVCKDTITVKGLFGHMWLHSGIIHLVGNMLFLWIFGNAVCSKIGNTLYLSLYIFLGLIAVFAHLIFQGGAVIGASGAIMGVVGMYIGFFPKNDITCYFIWILFFRPIFHEFTLSSYWMVLFWLVFDIYGAAAGEGGVAYFAHLGGFFAGFGVAILMLKMGWVKMNPRYEESLLDIFTKKEEPDFSKPIDPTYAWLTQNATEVENKDLPKEQITDTSVRLSETTKQSSHSKKIVQNPVRQSSQEVDTMIRFVCPCGKRIKVPSKYAGKTGKCPRCGNRVKIPENR